MSATKTSFGLLLEQYLSDRELNQLKLERLLNENGYSITNGLVSKYNNGTREPPALFIHRVVILISLSDEEENALLQAHLADISFRFLSEYRDVSIRYQQGIQRGDNS